LRSDLAKWRALPATERRELAAAFALLVAHQLCLMGFGLRRAQRWLCPAPRTAAGTPERSIKLTEIAARRLPFRPDCLCIALTLQHILVAQGIDSELRLGVRRSGDRLEAHAWLERQGRVLVDTREDGAPFLAFERALPPHPLAAR
jgi:hypothetical protein